MKKITLLFLSFLTGIVIAQDPQLTSWKYNTDGNTASYYKTQNGPGQNGATTLIALTDSSDVKRVYYNDTYVFALFEGLSSTIMGPWNIPNVPVAQGYVYQIPRNPSEKTGSKTAVPAGGAIAFAVDGIAVFGYESAESWIANRGTVDFNGDEIWNADAWVTEGETMDASLGAHAQQQGVYHYHATPFDLYDKTNTTSHSPIVAWSPDGYPVYGPYGYDSPMDSKSGISRMVSGYAKRNITQRHRLPGASSDLSSGQWGPDVSTTYPVGYFVEDYEFNSDGDLDVYNGRVCVTPEYPNGTYAYFITIDEASEPAHPYIFAKEYYGVVTENRFGKSTLPTGVTKYTGLTPLANGAELLDLDVYPNPVADQLQVETSGVIESIVLRSQTGVEVLATNRTSLDLSGFASGTYFLFVTTSEGRAVRSIVVQ